MKPRIIALTARRAVVLIVAGYGALYAPGRRICCAGRAGDTRAPRPNLNSTSRARLLPSREYTQIEREPLQCQITSVISFRPVCRESYSGSPRSSCLGPSSSLYSTSCTAPESTCLWHAPSNPPDSSIPPIEGPTQQPVGGIFLDLPVGGVAIDALECRRASLVPAYCGQWHAADPPDIGL
jgi:hypothetical protein